MPPPLHYLRSAFHQPEAALPAQHALGRGSHQFPPNALPTCRQKNSIKYHHNLFLKTQMSIFHARYTRSLLSGTIEFPANSMQRSSCIYQYSFVFLPCEIMLHLEMLLLHMRSNLTIEKEQYRTITFVECYEKIYKPTSIERI